MTEKTSDSVEEQKETPKVLMEEKLPSTIEARVLQTIKDEGGHVNVKAGELVAAVHIARADPLVEKVETNSTPEK